MLVVNPSARAPLSEVLAHPWIVRGYGAAPDAHMLHREPLRAEELDKHVIKGMSGFEFGTEDDVERKLVDILESDAYARAVQHWERKRQMNGRNGHPGISNASLVSNDSAISSGSGRNDTPSTPTKQKSRRFSGFDFYRRKLFSPSSSPPDTPQHRSPPTSSSHLSHTSLNDLSQREPPDPTAGFHPLISMYFLAREKLERERVYGPGHFASSQMSLLGKEDGPPPPPSAMKPIPSYTKGRQPDGTKADYNMQLPRLPAPDPSHYSGMSYDATGAPQPAVPSPTTPGFTPQPRARDAGLPIPKQSDVPSSDNVGVPSSAPPTTTKAQLPRAPPASTHRRSHSLSQRPMSLKTWGGMLGGHQADKHEPPATAGPELGTFAEKMDAGKEFGVIAEKEEEKQTPLLQPEPALHQTSAGATLVRRFGTLLGGVRGDDTKRGKRTSIIGSLSPRPSGDGSGDTEKVAVEDHETPQDAEKQALKARGDEKENEGVTQSQSQPIGTVHRRAATILDPQGRATRHERRSSTGASLFATAGGTIGRHRRPSTSAGPVTSGFPGKYFGRMEEEDETLVSAGGDLEGEAQKSDEEADREADKEFKPVFLKGLFR